MLASWQKYIRIQDRVADQPDKSGQIGSRFASAERWFLDEQRISRGCPLCVFRSGSGLGTIVPGRHIAWPVQRYGKEIFLLKTKFIKEWRLNDFCRLRTSVSIIVLPTKKICSF